MHCNIRVLSKIYWQVADQPGKESPNYLRIVDLEGKEVKVFVILERIGNADASCGKEEYGLTFSTRWQHLTCHISGKILNIVR